MHNTIVESPYSCLYCRKALFSGTHSLVCPQCAFEFEVRDGIPILTGKERYWCNLPKDKMRQLNEDAAMTHWREAVERHIQGNTLSHIYGESRIDFRYILPALKDKKVLDIGAMWGGVAIPTSRYAKEVYAIDTTYETLQLLNIRIKQDNINNVNLALASAHNLPFSEDYFDIVFLIGVLEWLGSDYDFIVSQHYGKRRRCRHKNRCNPYRMQCQALSQVNRVLKPGGVVLTAIENRFFYKYFLGRPDDHTAVPFTSILPRFAAHAYMRLLKNQGYYEFTHSYGGYKKLFTLSGFKEISFYAVLPNYRQPNVIIPIDDNVPLSFYFNNFRAKFVRGIKKFIPAALVKLNIMKYLVPSFLILAKK